MNPLNDKLIEGGKLLGEVEKCIQGLNDNSKKFEKYVSLYDEINEIVDLLKKHMEEIGMVF